MDDLAQNQCNPQTVWKELNKITEKGCKERIGTIQVNGHDITRNQDKAEEFNKYFANCIPSPLSISSSPVSLEALERSFSFHRVEPEVERILRGLKVNKATGPDGLSNRLLKLAAPAIAKRLATIYNASLENGE